MTHRTTIVDTTPIAEDIFSPNRNGGDQIYYHTINPAFQYLKQNESDQTESNRITQPSFDHWQKSTNGDYWETETKAETNLYLNFFNESKKLYLEALLRCEHDLRIASSMIINAII